jgi:hypothetical protein
LAVMRGVAARAEREGRQSLPEGFDEALEQEAARYRRTPPFLHAGRLAFYGGLALAVMAAVVWFRQPPAPELPAEEGSEPGEAGFRESNGSFPI